MQNPLDPPIGRSRSKKQILPRERNPTSGFSLEESSRANSSSRCACAVAPGSSKAMAANTEVSTYATLIRRTHVTGTAESSFLDYSIAPIRP